MERGGGHVFGDQDHFDMTCFCLRDDLGHHWQVVFIFGIERQRDKFKRRRLGLAEKCKTFRKAQVAPGFAQFGFHIFDK